MPTITQLLKSSWHSSTVNLMLFLHKFQKAIQNYLAYCFLQTRTLLETHQQEAKHKEKNGFICDPKSTKKMTQEQPLRNPYQ